MQPVDLGAVVLLSVRACAVYQPWASVELGAHGHSARLRVLGRRQTCHVALASRAGRGPERANGQGACRR
jgi:hypothetical protein